MKILFFLFCFSLPTVLNACAATAPTFPPVTTTPSVMTTTPAAGTTTVAGMTTSTSTAGTTTSTVATTTTTVDKRLTCMMSPINTPPTNPNFRPIDMFGAIMVVNGANTMTVTCNTADAFGTNVAFAIVDANGQQPIGQFFGPPGPMVTYTLTCNSNGEWTVNAAGMEVVVYQTACTIP